MFPIKGDIVQGAFSVAQALRLLEYSPTSLETTAGSDSRLFRTVLSPIIP